MTYYLGIDIGTTYTAAAVWRDGRCEIASLGNRAPTIPSVVLLRDDQAVLTGEAAVRRAATEPDRVAREFKRRIGDPVPIIVAGTPYSADALMAKLLRSVVEQVAEVEGGPAAGIAVSHPANWGAYKLDLLRQSISLADLDNVATVTEPEAAAIHYASLERVEPGSVIAVYDLGGGTFDAAVLRKTDGGWEILGQPEGIERLGGVDFDAAVYHHVAKAVGGIIDDLDPDDPTAQAAVARLQQECVDAKEALSSDSDTAIPVLLPNLQTEVRLTRKEYEQMVRPSLSDTITAMNRALRSAEVKPEDVTAVLLVGGSSRTPLVAELVSSALGRPVAVDAHPKYGVALGAAITAAHHTLGEAAVGAASRAPAGAMPQPGAAPDPFPSPAPAGQPAPAVAPLPLTGNGGHATGSPAGPTTSGSEPSPATAQAQTSAGPAGPAAPTGPARPPDPQPPDPTARQQSWAPPDASTQGQRSPVAPYGASAAAAGTGAGADQATAAHVEASDPSAPPPGRARRRAAGGGRGGDGPPPGDDAPGSHSGGPTASRRPVALVAGGVLALALIGGGAYLGLAGGGDGDGETGTGDPTAEVGDPGSTAPDSTAPPPTTTTTEPPPQGPFVQINDVQLQGGRYLVNYQVFGYTPDYGEGELHVHFFPDTQPAATAGTNGTENVDDWDVTDEDTSFLTKYTPAVVDAGATQMCSAVADHTHAIYEPNTETGNCFDLPE